MQTMQNAMIYSLHGQEHLSFIGEHAEPAQAIAEKLADLVKNNAAHAYGEFYSAVAVRHCTTEHKGFDRKVAVGFQISDGNISSDVMRGQYIRPVCQTECNGLTSRPGQLQEFDIQTFASHEARSIISRWSEIVPEMQTETTIAYSFFTYQGKNKKHIGYLLVRAKDREVLRCHAVGERMKNESVMHAMRALLSSEGVKSKTRVASWSASGLTVYDPVVFRLLKDKNIRCSYQGPLGTVRHSC